MTTIEYILTTVGIITLLFTTIAITLYLLRKFIRPTATTLLCKGKGIILTKSGNPELIFFSELKAANDFLEKCNHAGLFWDVYWIDYGSIYYIGNTRN